MGPGLTAASAPSWGGRAWPARPHSPPAPQEGRESGDLASGLPQPVISCVTFNRSLPLSGPQFSYLQNEEMAPGGLSGCFRDSGSTEVVGNSQAEFRLKQNPLP